jgi:hypothetical protein
MEKRLFNLRASLICFLGCFFVGFVAWADRSETFLSSSARVDVMCIRRDADGTITAEAWGKATTADAGAALDSSVTWTLTSTARTQAATMLDGAALTRWKQQERL